MEEKYKEYIISFDKLDIYDKRKEITNELLELIQIFHKINNDFNIKDQVLPIFNEEGNEEQYLTKLFSYILSLKETTSSTIQLIQENLYEQ